MIEGYLVRPNGQTLQLESVIDESRTMNNTVTSHPIEGGSKVSDHIFLNNKTIKVEVIISDATFAEDNTGVTVTETNNGIVDFVTNHIGFVAQFLPPPIPPSVINVNLERDVAAEGRRLMEEIRDARELLTLDTSIGLVENVVVKSVTSSRNKDLSRHTYKFSLSLEQIQVVEQSAKVSIAKMKPEIKDGASDELEAGKQGKKEDPTYLTKFNKIISDLVR